MIYTVTFNPSLDYVIHVDDYKLGMVNRVNDELILPGGKGINVSIVLKSLGHMSIALGFTAGFSGEEIAKLLENQGCVTKFITLSNGFSRINVKLKTEDETDINGNGPEIQQNDIKKLFEILGQLGHDDFLVLAGSIPDSLPDDIYEQIMRMLNKEEVSFVVDATRDLLMQVLKYRPFLIKPNHHELGEIFGIELQERKDVIEYGLKLKEMGARNVLVSMASEGAVLLADDGNIYESDAPKGKVVNSVGAGDSMVAGFLSGYIETKDYKNAFYKGIAAGSASAFSKYLATKEEVESILNMIQVDK